MKSSAGWWIGGHPPPVPVGPDTIVLSADGAMVPLVGGTWAEVKTLVIGELGAPTWVKGEQQTHTVALSYFSRLTDSADFERLALVETHRRGVESARAVAAVTDGAEWLQHFIDDHRPDAVRILDFPHAAEYISTIGAVTLGDGHSPPAEWFNTQLHQLKHAGPAPVLATLRALHTAAPQTAGVAEALAYLEKREALMQYPTFQAAGWPMGSGCVESANKLVVEARLKGSGMHWQRPFVNPMLAVRNVVCNNRWSETWPLVVHARRQLIHTRQATRRQQRQARLSAVTPAPRSSPPPAGTPINDPTPIAIAPPPSVDALSSERSRPAPNHPWRRMPFGKALFQPKPKG